MNDLSLFALSPIITQKPTTSNALVSPLPHIPAIEDVPLLLPEADPFIEMGGAGEASGVHFQSGRLHPLIFQKTKALVAEGVIVVKVKDP